jgi:hypothetical protein
MHMATHRGIQHTQRTQARNSANSKVMHGTLAELSQSTSCAHKGSTNVPYIIDWSIVWTHLLLASSNCSWHMRCLTWNAIGTTQPNCTCIGNVIRTANSERYMLEEPRQRKSEAQAMCIWIQHFKNCGFMNTNGWRHDHSDDKRTPWPINYSDRENGACQCFNTEVTSWRRMHGDHDRERLISPLRLITIRMGQRTI